MELSTDPELKTIRRFIEGAAVSDEARSTALWCLGRLPELYVEFCRTHNVRQGDEARRLVEGMLMALADGAVTERIIEQLRVMHTRLGLHVFTFAAPREPQKAKVARRVRPTPPSAAGR
jgi:hypothetical protein